MNRVTKKIPSNIVAAVSFIIIMICNLWLIPMIYVEAGYYSSYIHINAVEIFEFLGYLLLAVGMFYPRKKDFPLLGAIFLAITCYRLKLLAYLCLIAIIIVCTTDKFQKFKKIAEKWFFVPALVLSIIEIIIPIFNIIGSGNFIYNLKFMSTHFSWWIDIIEITAFLFAGLYISRYEIEINEEETDNQSISSGKEIERKLEGEEILAESENCYNPVYLKVIIFVAMIIWTKLFLPCMNDVFGWLIWLGSLVLAVFLWFFIPYWMGKMELVVTNKRIFGKTAFGKRVDLPLDSVSAIGTSILWGIDVGTSSGRIHFKFIRNQKGVHTLMSGLLMERNQKMNTPVATPVSAPGTADELKKFKDLLDSGIITQEEFDAKKKQLLNL